MILCEEEHESVSLFVSSTHVVILRVREDNMLQMMDYLIFCF